MSIAGNVALVVDFLEAFFAGNTDKFMDSIDDNAILFGKNKSDFAAMVKPKRSVRLERTITQGDWIAVEFDSDEQLRTQDLKGIAAIRFSFFVQVVNGKIVELRDYIGIKDERGDGGELEAYLCWPSRCPRC